MCRLMRIAASLVLAGALCGVPIADAQVQDIIGLYFDTAAASNTLQTTDSPQQVTAYLILREPSAMYGVSGWECEIENLTGLDGLEPVVVLGWEIAAGYNFAEPPRFWVGIGTFDPLPSGPAVLLATGHFLVPHPLATARLFIHPFEPPSLQDPPGSGHRVAAPIYAAGHDAEDLRPLALSSGSPALPVAVINPSLGAPRCRVAPVLPRVLEYGWVAVADFRDDTFAVSNIGGGLLEGVVPDPASPDFTIIAGGGAFALGPGEARAVTVRFAPLDEGPRSCLVDVCGATVELRGAGYVSGACTVTPESLEIGPVYMGQTGCATFTIAPQGGSPVSGVVTCACDDFAVQVPGSPAGSYFVPPGSTLTVTVCFTPAALGTSDCWIDLDGACPDVHVSGEGIDPTAECHLSTYYLAFGDVPVGQHADRSFTIANVGGGLLEGDVVEDCQHFEVVEGGGPFGLAGGATRAVTVRYEPLAGGLHTCDIDLGTALCPAVRCGGAAPHCVLSADSLVFGELLLGQSLSRSFTITNGGDGLLNGTVSLGSCAFFSLVAGGGPYTLGAGGIRTVTVSYQPAVVGQHTCVVHTGVACGDVQCAGEAYDLPPECQVTPASLSFGEVVVGETRSLTFTIRNIGGGLLLGEVGEACERFTIVAGGGSFALAGGQSRVVRVRFAPLEEGPLACDVELGTACGAVHCTGEGIFVTEPQDLIGIYFDLEGSSTFLQTTQVLQPITAYMLLVNASSASGVSGWECCVDVVGNLLAPGWTISAGGINFQTPPCFAVGIGTLDPLPWSPAILLATLDAFVPTPSDVILFFVGPAPAPSIPGYPAYAQGDDATVIIPMNASSGSFDLPIAAVNSEPPPIGLAPAPAASCQGSSVSITWSYDSERYDGCHLYRREGSAPGAVPGTTTIRLTDVPLQSGDGRLTYIDPASDVASGTVLRYSYALLRDGAEIARSPETIVTLTGGVPAAFALRDPYPNPFNPAVTIPFELPRAARVTLEIYDAMGRRVRALLEGELPAAAHARVWDGCDDAGRRAPSGTYYARLTADGGSALRKLTLLK